MSIRKAAALALSDLRIKNPLVHFITNYVTVNDVANAALAIGASPVMADALEEAADITSLSGALVLNIGTLNSRTIASMTAAGKRAGQLGLPVVLDPVGAGASAFRTETAAALLSVLNIAVLRGNLSEIRCVAGFAAAAKGVDAAEADEGADGAAAARAAAEKYGCVAAVTGAVDVISDGKRVVRIQNGHPLMKKVTGTGCMAAGLIGAFAGAGAGAFTAAVAGVASMGIAGELGFEKAGALGTGSYRAALLDALSRLDADLFLERAKLHEA